MIRKILTQEEKDRRDKRNKSILAFVIGIIMLLSTVGYAFFSFEDRDSNVKKQKIKIGRASCRERV